MYPNRHWCANAGTPLSYPALLVQSADDFFQAVQKRRPHGDVLDFAAPALAPANAAQSRPRESDDEQLQLVLIDHGNMRFDGLYHGSLDAGLADRVRYSFAIAEDDARSANPMVLPSSMAEIKVALDGLTADSDDLGQSGTSTPSDIEDEEIADDKKSGARTNLLIFAHSHIDDLESACYLRFWSRLCRSLNDKHTLYKEAVELLHSLTGRSGRMPGPSTTHA